MARTLRELFVNRTRQIDAFRRMLEGQISRRIMILTAGPGMGKSWVLRIFAQEAQSRNLPLAQFDFADEQAYDALTLVRRSCDALGSEHFVKLTQAINDATTARVTLAPEGGQPASVNVDIADSTVSSSPISVGDVGNIVKDNLFVIQTDNPLIRQVIEDRINSAFFECLAELGTRTKVVFLFDTYERLSIDVEGWVSSAADRWIIGQLLARIRDGKLPNVLVVLAGRRTPEFKIEWNEVLGRMSLEPIECEDVKIYLREKRGLSIITDAEANRLCQAVAGNPQVLGLIGDNLEQANKKGQDDEW